MKISLIGKYILINNVKDLCRFDIVHLWDVTLNTNYYIHAYQLVL